MCHIAVFKIGRNDFGTLEECWHFSFNKLEAEGRHLEKKKKKSVSSRLPAPSKRCPLGKIFQGYTVY